MAVDIVNVDVGGVDVGVDVDVVKVSLGGLRFAIKLPIMR